MPTYLCHGFRWHRPSIRVFVIVQDIGDAAPDYISGQRSAAAILECFWSAFDFLPARDGAGLRLLEEYDPALEDAAWRPFAYVVDHAVRVDLSAPVADEVASYEARLRGARPAAMAGPHSDETGRRLRAAGDRRAGWLERLRDQLQRGEEIKWFVVVNADEERRWDGDGEGAAAQSARGDWARHHHAPEEEEDDDDDDRREWERQKLRQRLGGLSLGRSSEEEEDEGDQGFLQQNKHGIPVAESSLAPIEDDSPRSDRPRTTNSGTSGLRRLFTKSGRRDEQLR